MLKNKMVILICLITVLLAGSALGYGIYINTKSNGTFTNSGYILIAPDNTYSDDDINTQIYFEKGTTYKKVYPNKIVFRDQKNKKRVLDEDSFVHYNDGGVSSLTEGVMVDMNSFDSPLTNYYGLSPDSVMEDSGEGYAIDNRGNEMDFQNALWKINDTKYLLLSKNIDVKFSEDNERKFKDYIEIDYYDTGIIRIVTTEGTWETVSADCTATLDNGVELNLYTRTVVKDEQVKLSLKQMVVDSDQNIDIVPEEIKTEANKAPKLDIQTIDGTTGEAGKEGKAGENGIEGKAGEDGTEGVEGTVGTDGTVGVDGQAGTNGEAGNPGEPGTTGTTGTNGNNGTNGQSGANGAAGTNGQKGEEGSTPLDTGTIANGAIKAITPEFSIKTLEAKTNSVKASIVVTDQENRLDPSKDFTIEIVENNTGKRVYMTQVDSGNRDFSVEYNGLVANKEYRLVLTAEYSVNNANYSNIFINKVFMTDSLGMTVEKSSASDNTLSLKVLVKDYCQVSEADLQLLDKDGKEVKTSEIHMTLARQNGEEVLTFSSLSSNSVYKAKFVNIKLSYDQNLVAAPQVQPEEYMTLKKAPTLGDPEVVTNKRDGSFEFHLKSVTDPDKAIKNFRYEIYEVGLDSSETLVKTLNNTTDEVVSCLVDDTIIKRNYNYRMRVVAECYDNEKEVEIASTYSTLFSMKGNDYPILLFQKNEDETHHDDIAGSLLIDTNGTKLTVDSNNTLIIELKNSKGDVDDIYINDEPQKAFLGNNQYRYTIPIKQNNLLANDNYIISVFGTLDLNDGAGPHKSLVGNIVTKTDAPNGFKGSISQGGQLVSPISFSINLSDASASASSAYEAGTMKYVEVNLYNGDETAVTKEAPVATYTITGTDAQPLKSKLYGTNSLQLTAEDFKISPASITSSKYTVEISSVRDYTKYGNEFTVQNNIQTFDKQATLPDLSTMDVNNGLTIIPITLSNISQYVSAAEVANYQKYDSDIVFGYDVRAAYFDNSAQLIDSFDYYAFEEKDYTTATTPAKAASADFYALNLKKAIVTVAVPETGAVPRAVFLFGKNEATGMSRGSRYVFTYRAKMKKPDSNGITYFPDTQSTSAIIRSKSMSAPYQQPRFYFYPWISDASSATWKYYIDAPDTSAITSNFAVNKGGVTAGGTAQPNKYDTVGNPVEVTVGGLTRGDIYSLRITTSQFKSIYGQSVTNTLVGQYFEGDYTFQKATTSLTFMMDDFAAQNRYKITINDSDVNMSSISRVVALKVYVYDKDMTGGAPLKTIIVPFEYITPSVTGGGSGVAYLRYSDIKEFIGKTLDFTIAVVYDSGISGFKDTVNASCAVQLLPSNGKGNYLMLNTTSTALVENSTGNAMGSYYRMLSMNNQTGTTDFDFISALEDSFTGKLSFTNNANGSRLLSQNGQPYATLKSTREVGLQKTDNRSIDFSRFTFSSMTPTVNLNKGSAYTIDTMVTSATVHWTLTGQDEKLAAGDIQGSKMYFDLYRITPLGVKEDLHRTIPTTIVSGTYKYDTSIDNLTNDTKYGIVIYYLDKAGNRVYPINAYLPDKDAASNIYTFTTSTTITVTPTSTAVRYVANSYLDKYLEISYTLNQTLGFNINYSICQKQGASYKVLLDSNELASRGIISTPLVNKETMSDERIILSPGKLYWKDDSGNTVYFPFNSTDYYLCVKPVSETNSSIELGTPTYIQLNVTPLNTPFYKIKTVPQAGSVEFQVSVLDIGKVMVGGHYKIKILDGSGKDITGVYKQTYSITKPETFTVTGIPSGGKAVLHVYSVHDMLNTGKGADDSVLQDISTVLYDGLDADGKGYLKVSYTGYPLTDSGYDLGDVQIQQSSSEHARIYFTDSVNLDKIKYIRYVVVNEAGLSYNYYEPFTFTKLNDTTNYYELSHQFTATGVYQIQTRFYDEIKTQLDDLALTYYKSY